MIRQVLDDHQREIDNFLRGWRVALAGTENLDAHIEWNRNLTELLVNQRRALEYHAGKTPEPMTHFGSAVIPIKGGAR